MSEFGQGGDYEKMRRSSLWLLDFEKPLVGSEVLLCSRCSRQDVASLAGNERAEQLLRGFVIPRELSLPNSTVGVAPSCILNRAVKSEVGDLGLYEPPKVSSFLESFALHQSGPCALRHEKKKPEETTMHSCVFYHFRLRMGRVI